MIWYKALFSFQGRLNRKGFWQGFGINLLLLFLFANLLPDPTAQPLALLPLLLVVYSFAAVVVKRLHDRNRSGKAAFIWLVPVVCFATSAVTQGIMAWLLSVGMPIFVITMLLIEQGAFKGEPEPNAYGAQSFSIRLK